MSNDAGIIDLEGVVEEVLRGQIYRVRLENNHVVQAYTSGRLKKHKIRIVLGDRVRVEITPYDLTKGRISKRL